MSAVIAEGQDGEPGGYDAAETVITSTARGNVQVAEIQWAGRVTHLLLGLDGQTALDGWKIPEWVKQNRRDGGH